MGEPDPVHPPGFGNHAGHIAGVEQAERTVDGPRSEKDFLAADADFSPAIVQAKPGSEKVDIGFFSEGRLFRGPVSKFGVGSEFVIQVPFVERPGIPEHPEPEFQLAVKIFVERRAVKNQ